MTETIKQDEQDVQDNQDAPATDADQADATEAPDQAESDKSDNQPDFGEFAQVVTDYAEVLKQPMPPQSDTEARKARGAKLRALRDKLATAVETAENDVDAALDADDMEAAQAASLRKKQAKAAENAIGVTKVVKVVNWPQRVANRVKTLRAAADALEGAKPGKYGIPQDADMPDELPEGVIDDKRLKQVLDLSLGPVGTKAKQHSTIGHIVEVVHKAGKWLTTAEIANITSDAYEGGSAGNGAINAAFDRGEGQPDPKLDKYGIKVEKRSNGGDKPVWGAAPKSGYKGPKTVEPAQS